MGKRAEVIPVGDVSRRLQLNDVPSELSDELQGALEKLQENHQASFDGILSRLTQSLGRENPASSIRLAQSLLFECNGINRVVDQGLETLTPTPFANSVTFQGYPASPISFSIPLDNTSITSAEKTDPFLESLSEKYKQRVLRNYDREVFENEVTYTLHGSPRNTASIFSAPPHSALMHSMFEDPGGRSIRKEHSPLDSDIPIERNEKSYLYEVKAYYRTACGSGYNVRNQVLKYNQAVEEGVATGATAEITGRVDPHYLHWATGEGVDDLGPIPNVEILYSLPLPSGKNFRFVLKGVENEGLRFANELQGARGDDLLIMRGVQQAIVDQSIFTIISEISAEDFPRLKEKIAPESSDRSNFDKVIENPRLLTGSEEYTLYHEELHEALWNRFKQKALQYRVNDSINRTALDPSVHNPKEVEHVLVSMQRMLTQNPDLAKTKSAYIVDESDYHSVVAETVRRLGIIRDREQERIALESIPETPEHTRALRRNKLGFSGEPAGVGLDVEHVLMDVIQGRATQEDGTAKRSYDHPERFMKAADIPEYLKNTTSRRFLSVTVIDPVSRKSSERSFHKGSPEENISRLEREIRKENIERLLELLDSEEMPTSQARRINRVDEELQQIDEEKTVKLEKVRTQVLEDSRANKIKPDFSTVKELSREYLAQEDRLLKEKEDALIEAVGGQSVASRVMQQISGIADQEIIKFIYIVNGENDVILQEEKVRGVDAGRAAHSELASGGNVFGAGEEIFAKHHERFETIEAWRTWNEQFDTELVDWELYEINNGSGHYRPPSSTLEYTFNLMKEEIGDLVGTNVRLRDCIARGVGLREAGVF